VIAAGEGLANTNKANELQRAWYPGYERLGSPAAAFEEDGDSDAPGEPITALKLCMTTEDDGRQRMVDIGSAPFMRRKAGGEIITGGLGEMWQDLPDHRLRLYLLGLDSKTGKVEHAIFRKLGDGYAEWRWFDDDSPGGTSTPKKVSVIDEAEATRRILSLMFSSRYPEPGSPQPQPAWKVPERPAQAKVQQAEIRPSNQSWKQKIINKIRRPLGGVAAQANVSPAPVAEQAKKASYTPRHIAGPEHYSDPDISSDRRLRAGRAVVGVVSIVAGSAVLGVGVPYVLSHSQSQSSLSAAPSATANSNHAGNVSASPTATSGNGINIIAGAAIPVNARGNPDGPPLSSAPAPVRVAPAPNFDAPSWTVAAHMEGQNKAMGMVTQAITSWDTVNPQKALYLGRTPDGKWEAIHMRTASGDQLIDPDTEKEFNQSMYQNNYRLAA